MTRDAIPADLRRFILTSVLSVPYLEAMLLLRAAPQQLWDARVLAQRLYLSEKSATELLAQLHAAGVLAAEQPELPAYRYAPAAPELSTTIDRLAEVYAKNLVEVTHLIHSKMDKKAQQFADAFKWRRDS